MRKVCWTHCVLRCGGIPVALCVFVLLLLSCWYCSCVYRASPVESADLTALRGALFGGLCHASDSGLRAHCAALTAELLHWECKHVLNPGKP